MSARLLDKRRPDGTWPFPYRNSASTDIRETFERARKEQAQKQSAPVRNINQRKAGSL